MLLTRFDPWRSKLCTCPLKYSLNVYTGCGHGCLYCYSSSYIRDFHRPRAKRDFVRRLRREAKFVEGIISISNSTDPYQPIEAEYRHTSQALKILQGKKKLLVTKSDLVLRDLNLLEEDKNNVVLSLTVTTLDEELAKLLEPRAPEPGRRLEAMQRVSEAGIPVALRLDPLIPYLNDNPLGIKELLKESKAAGAAHVTASTYKTKPDNFRRMCEAFPELVKRWQRLYSLGERCSGYRYLPRALRLRLLLRVRKLANSLGMSFSACREGFAGLNTSQSCDGSHLFLSPQRSAQLEQRILSHR